MVRIDVTDTGAGMDDETITKIYDPLFTTKEEGGGTGLGLFVVKYILDEYSGKIDVQSQKGKGTTFKVFFPLILEQPSTPNRTTTENRTSDNDLSDFFVSEGNWA